MRKTSLILLTLLATSVYAQDDELLELLESDEAKDRGYVSATFKGTRLINGHSVETRTNRGVGVYYQPPFWDAQLRIQGILRS